MPQDRHRGLSIVLKDSIQVSSVEHGEYPLHHTEYSALLTKLSKRPGLSALKT